ncbi:MAG: 30S ribosomal protein S1 [Bacteroidales bacterium]|nr:30S ribosomal protein S1 [Bacteroidales bacterium]
MSEDQNEKTNETEEIQEPKVITSEELQEQNQKAEVLNASTLDFDWDQIEKDKEITSEKKDLEEIYGQTLSTIESNEVIEGYVIAITDREVVINISYKSEGVVALNEFRYNPDLKIGDKVEVLVVNTEDETGQLVLSHKRARVMNAWDKINVHYTGGDIVKGFIKSRTKGGMIVDLFGIETFLPGSQIDVKPITDYDAFVGNTMDFKILNINLEFKNVVVSHKAIIEDELEEQKKDIIAKLEVGQILEGIVKNITQYGVFMDLGGVDGLIHITHLSWGRISHPSEVVEIGQKLKVVILNFDEDKKRIELGLKQLQKHPWDELNPDLKVGDVVEGKVVVLADYGAFVEIAPGVEGLIHVSEMSWSQHLHSAQDFLKVGDVVEAKILTLDREQRRMSLGLKQTKPDPWEKIDERYPVGSKHIARVRSFSNFGIFVEIEEGVDGLVHISDLSWTKKINHPSEFTKVGENIDVIVLEIDQENRRLSLGHKQLEENPWDVFETVFYKDSVHDGTIISVFDKGASVLLPYGVEGFASKRHIKKDDNSFARPEEKLPFKVIEFSKVAKRIVVSHTKVWEDKNKVEEEKQKVKSDKVMSKQSNEKTTLGDIANLDELKEKLLNKSENLDKDTKEKNEE